MAGLLLYLVDVDPDRTRNVHENPRVVAADDAVLGWQEFGVLDRARALAVARVLDHPRKAFGVTVPGGDTWHVSLSLRAEEGRLTDEKWGQIARDFVAEMGYDGSDGKAPCRWVFVRHGLSKAGNDHGHLALSLVREDGTKASTWNDYKRAQQVCRELERRHGRAVLESRDRGRGSRGVSKAELERQARVGAVEPERVALGRIVRGAAAAAVDEAEFVARLRAAGVRPRPWYEKGSGGQAVGGYSVQAAGSPIRLGGGRLGPDLSLPRLRQRWPDTAAEAVPVWKGADSPVRSPAGTEADWRQATGEVAALQEWLRGVDPADTGAVAAAAGDVAGVFAGWSTSVEGGAPGAAAAASDALARSAEVRAHLASRPAGLPPTRSAARLVASAVRGGQGSVAEAALWLQLRKTAEAIHEAHVAARDAQRAERIAAVMAAPVAAPALTYPAATPSPDPGDRGGHRPVQRVPSVPVRGVRADRGGEDRGR